MSADGTLNRMAARQHGVFTSAQAVGAGFSRRQIEYRALTGAWIRLARGVFRVPGAPPSWLQRVMSAVLAGGPGAAASGRTACALWGLPGFKRNVVEVSRPRSAHHRGVIGTAHEPRRRARASVLEGIPVTAAARALADIASVVPFKRLERAVDNALAMELVTLEELRGQIRRGRPGAAKLRKILEVRDDRYVPPQSELEATFLDLVKKYGLPSPDLQVYAGGKDMAGRVDFVYRAARLVVEVDSRRHHMSRLDFESDRVRDIELAAAGYRPLRLSREQMRLRPEWVASKMRAALRLSA